jgi:hypothetical protein
MEMETSEQSGCVLAFVLVIAASIAVVAGFTLASAIITDQDLDLAEEWGPLLFQISIVAIPMLLLLALRESGRFPWATCIFLTLFFWSLYLWSGIASHRNRSGVNFGVAFLMLASPFVISAASIGTAALSKRKRRPVNPPRLEPR